MKLTHQPTGRTTDFEPKSNHIGNRPAHQDNNRKHGEPWFSGTLVIGDPQENVENPEDFFQFFQVFWVFQAEHFGKLSAPVFRIFLDWSRAPETKIRPISSNVFVFFQFFDRTNV